MIGVTHTIYRFPGLVLLVLLLLPSAAPAQCAGDCNGDGSVAINELITAVNVALGVLPLSSCESLDTNDDGEVGINELIAAVNNALDGCGPLPTPTPTATATMAGPTSTPEPAIGPAILYFGITTPDDRSIEPTTFEDGIPVFVLPQGRAFHIVAEAGRGLSDIPPGIDTFSDSGPPSFQIQADHALGNASTTVCDVEEPNAGGVPAVSPPSFDYTEEIVDALNDLGCRFQNGDPTSPPVTSGRACTPGTACVRFEDGDFGCISPMATRQYCSTDISVVEEFRVGDTVVSARVLETRVSDRDPMPGPVEKIIIRVQPPFPG